MPSGGLGGGEGFGERVMAMSEDEIDKLIEIAEDLAESLVDAAEDGYLRCSRCDNGHPDDPRAIEHTLGECPVANLYEWLRANGRVI